MQTALPRRQLFGDSDNCYLAKYDPGEERKNDDDDRKQASIGIRDRRRLGTVESSCAWRVVAKLDRETVLNSASDWLAASHRSPTLPLP